MAKERVTGRMCFGAIDTVDYAAFGFLIACMIWTAAMTLRPDKH